MSNSDQLLERSPTYLEYIERLHSEKLAYEAKHPETRQGCMKQNLPSDKRVPCFAVEAAKARGVDPKLIWSDLTVARNLSDTVKRMIAGTPLANKKTRLIRIARLPVEQQEDYVKCLSNPRRNQPHVQAKQATTPRSWNATLESAARSTTAAFREALRQVREHAESRRLNATEISNLEGMCKVLASVFRRNKVA